MGDRGTAALALALVAVVALVALEGAHTPTHTPQQFKTCR